MDDGDADHRQRHEEEEEEEAAAPCLLLAPQIESNDDHVVTTAGLYRWEERQSDDAALVCMPWTTAARSELGRRGGHQNHQAFGLGRDPSSGVYKVARFFHRSSVDDDDDAGVLGVEVLTIGTQLWRETAVPPPYPVIPGRTATFFKGSLLWTPKEDSYYGDAAQGFVRFSLDDGDDDGEPFSFTPAPPCVPRVDYAASSLAVLHGELCFAQPGPDYETSLFSSLELWVYHDDGDGDGRWERRYIVASLPLFRGYRAARLVTAYGDVIVILAGPRLLYRYNCRTGQHQHQHQQRAFAAFTDFVCLDRLRYHHPGDGTIVDYSTTSLSPHRLYEFDVIPYVPSLSAPVARQYDVHVHKF